MNTRIYLNIKVIVKLCSERILFLSNGSNLNGDGRAWLVSFCWIMLLCPNAGRYSVHHSVSFSCYLSACNVANNESATLSVFRIQMKVAILR